MKPEEREPPTCECRPQCWTRLRGNAWDHWQTWHRIHAPLPDRDFRNYFVRLVHPGHEDGMPVLERGSDYVIVDSPGEEA